MTKQEFLRRLRTAIAGDADYHMHWYGNDQIRMTSNLREASFCPLTYLAYREGHGDYDMAEYGYAAELLGISGTDADTIARAADNEGAPSLRDRLIAVCESGRRVDPSV